MIVGVGTDVLGRGRLTASLMGEHSAFVRRVYTARERRDAFADADPHLALCLRFSAKEAVFKCLGSDPDTARLNDIEITVDDGVWRAQLSGRLAEHAASCGIDRLRLDVSRTDQLIISSAVAEGD